MEQSLPQTSSKKVNPKPWWNEECKQARKEQNKAWRTFSKYPTTENLANFDVQKQIRHVGWEAKRASCTNYQFNELVQRQPGRVH